MKIRLPELKIHLPEIATPETAFFFAGLKKELERSIRKTGKGSSAFQERKDLLRKEGVSGKLNDIRFVRPLIELWTEDAEFRKREPLHQGLLKKIEKAIETTPSRRMGRLALREACHLFFTLYDALGDNTLHLGIFLQRQLARYGEKELLFGLDMLHGHGRFLLCPEAHLWFVDQVSGAGGKLLGEAQKYGISQNSRFYAISLNTFYLKRVKELRVNEQNDILMTIRDRKVYGAPYYQQERLGHSLVRILIDKLSSSGVLPSEQWLQAILAIAGDPRIPKSAQRYRDWWAVLGDAYAKRMRGWLSRMDMLLFLKIMEAFSEREGGEEMKKMFPKRKRFLEGLFSRNAVHETQLFLGKESEDYLFRYLREKKEEKPYYSRLGGSGSSNKTVFYFRMGNIHLFEGTHNFALSIMDRLPKHCPAGNYVADSVDLRLLGIGLQEKFQNEFGNKGSFYRITHHRNWLQMAYGHLKELGIPISAHDIMDREDYERGMGLWA